MPAFAWLFVLAAVFWFGANSYALALWLAIASFIYFATLVAISKVRPDWDWVMLEFGQTMTIRQCVIKALVVFAVFCVAWYLSILTGPYMAHAVQRAINVVLDPIFALIFGRPHPSS